MVQSWVAKIRVWTESPFKTGLAIFLLALLARAVFAIWMPHAVVWWDGYRYEKIALHLLHGEGFGSLHENRASVPTQPLLIALVYKLAGEHSYLALRLFFATLGALSCVLGSLIAARLFGRAAGAVAGILLAGYPYLAYLSALFEYPQTFFIFVMAIFFLLCLRFEDTGSKVVLFGAGLALGVGVLTVPTVLIYTLIFLCLLITRNVRETIARLAVVGIALLMTVGLWTARNYAAYGQLMVVNAAGGTNFWSANSEAYYKYGKKAVVPPCRPGYEDTDHCRATRQMIQLAREHRLDENALVREQERLSWQYGLNFVLADPARFVLLSAKRFALLWRPTPDAVMEGEAYGGKWRDMVAAATYIPAALLGIAGLVLSAREWRRLRYIHAYMLAFVLPYAVYLPVTRYRLPIDFLLILFASYAVVRLWQRVFESQDAAHRIRTAQEIGPTWVPQKQQ